MKKLSAFSGLALILAITVLFSLVVGSIFTSAINAPDLFVGVSAVLFVLAVLTPSSKSNMAYITFVQGICEKVQSSLVEIYGNEAPSLKRTQLGYLEAVQSSQNMAGVTKVPVDPGNGKKKIVRLKYIQRGVSSDITEDEDTTCTTEIEKQPFETDVEVTKYISTKGIKFTQTEMRKLCEKDSDFMQGVIRAELDILAKELNLKLITAQAANFGLFNPDISPDTYKEIVLINATTKGPIYMGESQIMEDFENIDTMGKPIVIGAGNIGHYARMTNIGCCNQDGINMGSAGQMDFFRDRFVENILGTNHFIGLVPGSVQLLTWNQFVGDYRMENDVFSHTTITDPVTGLTYDMKWKFNDCDGTFFLKIGVHYELFFLPSNAYAATDELYGVNGTLHYKGLDSDDTPYWAS